MKNKNITVIGVGRLGLGLALLIEKAGFNVCGVDILPSYVKSLNDKTFKTKEPEYELLLKNSINFKATTNLKEGLDHSDIVFIILQYKIIIIIIIIGKFGLKSIKYIIAIHKLDQVQIQ